MSKKMMLLALVVASAAMFALPAAASATEIHLDNVEEFSGTAGAGALTAAGEPRITCESGHVNGSVDPGGTTGEIHLDFTGCHTTVFGFTAKCRTASSEKDNTITTEGEFHLITTSDGPAILVTTDTVTVTCAGISNTVVHGAVIGTITEPACGGTSNMMTVKFGIDPKTGTQDHTVYTGNTYELTATTGSGGEAKVAALESTATIESESAGTLTCT